MLDLCYDEDSQADVDMNVVMTGAGEFVELQATAEKATFDDARLAEHDRARAQRHRRAGRNPAQRTARGAMILYCATTNPGKLREFRLAARERRRSQPIPGLTDIPRLEETGATFEENAVEKALYYSRFTAGPVFADDSGLEVDALGGAPGVYSARYAGAGRDRRRQQPPAARKAATASSNRTARFVCVIALAATGQACSRRFEASSKGASSTRRAARTASATIRYFFYEPFGCTFGEVDAERKIAVSHRGQALERAAQLIAAILAFAH